MNAIINRTDLLKKLATLHTQKVKALIRLQLLGFRIPPSAIADHNVEIEAAMAEASNWREHRYYYVRAVYSDVQYPHYSYELCEYDDIPAAISRLRRSCPVKSFDLVIQPLISFFASGAALLVDQYAITEQVSGAPATLLRGGSFMYRSIQGQDGRIASTSRGKQFNQIVWLEDRFCEAQVDRDVHDYSAEICCLVQQVRELPDRTVLEWGSTDDGIVIVDSKQLPLGSYRNLRKTLQLRIIEVSPDVSDGCLEELRFDFAKFDYIKQLEGRGNVRVILREGSALSHLCTYCASERIPCLVCVT